MELKKATRKQAKIKLALQGPSGAGKTMSALLLASGMTDFSKIAVIDTENRSADFYSHLESYNVLQTMLFVQKILESPAHISARHILKFRVSI